MSACDHVLVVLRAGRLVRLTETSRVANGHHQHRVYETSWDGRAAVCKAFAAPVRGLGLHESRILERLRHAGLPVPRVIWQGEGFCEACGAVLLLLVTERLAGEAADIVLQRSGLGVQFWEKCAEILDRQFAVESSRSTGGYLQERYARLHASHLTLLVADGHIPTSAVDVMAFAAKNLPDPQRLGLITFDWRLRHLFVLADTITGVIDVEYAKLGDPLLEIANFIHDIRICDPAAPERATGILLDAVPFCSTEDSIKTLLFYQARQAFAHAAIRSEMGDLSIEMIRAEIDLGLGYVAELSSLLGER